MEGVTGSSPVTPTILRFLEHKMLCEVCLRSLGEGGPDLNLAASYGRPFSPSIGANPMSEKYEPKHKMDQKLFRMRHSLAHILAEAVLQVRPKAQLGFGPPVRTGFYYDMLLEEPITENDLPDIEKRMRKIIQEKQAFKREDLPKIAALKKLEGMGQ